MRKKKGKWLINDKTLKEIIVFIIKLNIFLIPLYLLSNLKINIYPLQNFIASSVLSLLKIMGISATMKDLVIIVHSQNYGFAGFIDFDCTGWKSILAFTALIFATPNSGRKKLIGLSFLPLVFFINILRIAIVFFIVATYDAEYFFIIHSIGWSFGMIFIVLALWILWMKFIHYGKKGNKKNSR